jgi:outer membrane immunogenic protein
MKRQLVVHVALLTLIASPVFAGVTDWTGFYLGGNGGYNFSKSDAHYVDPGFSAYAIDSKPEGWSGGFQAGANLQLGSQWVFGLEGEFSFVDADDTIYDYASDAHGRPNNTIKTSSDYAGTVRARIGYAAGRFLPYLTAGGAGANAKVDATDGPLSESALLIGWTIGAGVEYALDKHWSIRAEYLYVDLGQHTWFSGKAWESSSDLTSHTLRMGVNFRF